MTDLHLFSLPDAAVPVEPPRRLSADARRTQQERVMLANGRHPATRRAVLDADWGFTCGDCANAERLSNGNRAWWKCRRHRLGMSHSAASDIRTGWPACDLLRIEVAA